MCKRGDQNGRADPFLQKLSSLLASAAAAVVKECLWDEKMAKWATFVCVCVFAWVEGMGWMNGQ